MGIKSATELAIRDICINYDFENVMFRWDHIEKKQYRKFYGEKEETPVPFDNKLYNDALLFGDEISATEYLNGKENRID